jgi:hypothetical protein
MQQDDLTRRQQGRESWRKWLEIDSLTRLPVTAHHALYRPGLSTEALDNSASARP